jgi:hypothetical protein
VIENFSPDEEQISSFHAEEKITLTGAKNEDSFQNQKRDSTNSLNIDTCNSKPST